MDILSTVKEQLINTDLPIQLFRLNAPRHIPELPKVLTEKPTFYEIMGGAVQAELKQGLFRVIEPQLSPEEAKVLKLIKNGLYEVINFKENENIEEYIEKSTRVIVSELDLRLTETTMKKIVYFIYKEIIGLGKIEPLLRDTLINEIHVSTNVEIIHKKYGKLFTDILLKEEELAIILRKVALHCKEELSALKPNIHCVEKGLEITINYVANDITKSTLVIKKITKEKSSPIDLILQRKVPPEALAFLWFLIERKKTIFIIKDAEVVHALTYFAPLHAKIFTDFENFNPSAYNETILGSMDGSEDYAFISNYKGERSNAALIINVDIINEQNAIVCYIRNGVLQSIKENGKIIFEQKEGKFYFSLDEVSIVDKNLLKTEFLNRTNILVQLAREQASKERQEEVLKGYKNRTTQ